LQGAEPNQQSPWEIFREDVQPEEILAEAPQLEPSLQARVHVALERLLAAPRFQLFHDTPTPDAVYSTGDDGQWIPWHCVAFIERSSSVVQSVRLRLV